MRVLLTWELGSGHGHWANLRPIADRLSSYGCEIFAVLREVTYASGSWQGPPGMRTLPAPRYSTPAAIRHPEPRTCVRVLEGVGYHDADVLTQMVATWRSLYELVQPDVICCEYSPTAILAARNWPAKTIAIGTGFASPPNISPLPDLQFWDPLDQATLFDEESQCLARINEALRRHKLPKLANLGQLFDEVDENMLLVLPELDHYDVRRDATYWGTYAAGASRVAPWPELPTTNHPCVFAYLKFHPLLPAALQAMQAAGCQVVAHIPGCDARLKRELAGKSIVITDGPVDLADVAKHCSAAVLNGNLTIATALLQCGLPIVNIPLHMEQLVTSARMNALGAASWTSVAQPQAIGAAVAEILANPIYKRYASAFQERWKDYSRQVVQERVLTQVTNAIGI